MRIRIDIIYNIDNDSLTRSPVRSPYNMIRQYFYGIYYHRRNNRKLLCFQTKILARLCPYRCIYISGGTQLKVEHKCPKCFYLPALKSDNSKSSLNIVYSFLM